MVQLDAVTVNPSLCPTNKIAPHRRQVAWDEKPRTFGVIHHLFRPGRPPHMDPLDDLQEQPQEDDPDDCGEIEDYDETDLSSRKYKILLLQLKSLFQTLNALYNFITAYLLVKFRSHTVYLQTSSDSNWPKKKISERGSLFHK